MARGDRDGWTRTVGWLKLLLPLTALVLLSLTFLVARNINPEDAIPYSDVDIEERLREPRMTDPVYSGTTADGAAITVTGAEARPEDAGAGQGASALVVFGTLETPDGGRTELRAVTAQIDPAGQAIIFDGEVTISNSTGYTVLSDRMRALLDRTELRSLAPVTANGPPGTISADQMVLTRDMNRADGYVLVFNGGVKLLYQPKD